MSLLIKGMEMPKNCAVCPFFVRSDSPKYPFVDCKLIGRLGSVFNAASGIPVDCPLVPVPPHGRLIEDEAVREQIDEWLDSVGDVVVGHGLSYYGELLGCIEDAPTIIEAEEGE